MAKKDLDLVEVSPSQGFRVFAYLPGGTVAPRADEIVMGKDWIPFGKDNLFLERMRELASNTVPLDQCIRMNALYLAGRRVVINKQQGDEMVPHEEADAYYKLLTKEQGESEFRSRTMMDVAFANARVWHDRYDAPGELTNLDHLDVMSVRSGKPNPETKRVEGYLVSPNWKKAASRMVNQSEDYRPVPYPRWNPENLSDESREKGQLDYAFGYKQGQRFYGIPFWLSCVPDAYNWSKIPQMYQADIDTGFSAQIWAHFEGKLTPAQQIAFDKDMQRVFTGSRGKRLMTSTGSPGEKLTITPIPVTNQNGEREQIREAAKLEIVNASMIPPILAGIDVKVGMSGQAPAIAQQWQRYSKTFIEPMQDLFFERPLLARLRRKFPDIAELYIETFSPFDEVADEVQSRQAYMRTTKVNEHRVLVQKLPELTLDGQPMDKDKKNADPRGELLLIEAGTSAGGGTETAPA